ncbi:MAG TPA: hypothetical protein DE179_08340 [Oceanospirillaceae bacterium]|nr:hypothetical protein [Oceanospirillaceae bacterium]
MTKITQLRLAIIAVMAAFIGLMLGLEWDKRQQGDGVCDASHQWCNSDVSGNSTAMRISSPHDGQIITPTPIQINFSGLPDANQLSVRLSGHNMYMGQFDIHLTRQTGDNHSWQAATPLPNCIPNHDMIWRLDFLPPYEGSFYFTSTENAQQGQALQPGLLGEPNQ